MCAECRSTSAWAAHGDQPLRISHAELAASDTATTSAPKTRSRWPLVLICLSVLSTGVSLWLSFRVLAPQPAGPLEPMFTFMVRTSALATTIGSLGLCLAFGLLLIERRSRRAPGRLAVEILVTLAAGVAAVGAGVLLYSAPAGIGWRYLTVPPLPDDRPGAVVARYRAATVVIFAPESNGDMRSPSFGTGTVVARTSDRAWVLTCSHVALPWLPMGAARRPADAQPLWITFADQRGAVGKVVYVAAPPLDVALVEVAIQRPPAPLPIADGSRRLGLGTGVVFVPNPMRAGWMVHYGTVIKRERHETPAGAYALVHTNLPVQPGDSGSAIIDREGEIVGLNTWAVLRSDGSIMSIPAAISLPPAALTEVRQLIQADRLRSLTR